MSLDESIREILKEVVRETFKEVMQEELKKFRESIEQEQSEKRFLADYPDMLTTKHVMEILDIKKAKMSLLMRRSYFPVFRLAGVRIPKDKFISWIEKNTQWMEENAQNK